MLFDKAVNWLLKIDLASENSLHYAAEICRRFQIFIQIIIVINIIIIITRVITIIIIISLFF